MKRKLVEHIVNEVIDILEANEHYEVWRFGDAEFYGMRFTNRDKAWYRKYIQEDIEHLLQRIKTRGIKSKIVNTPFWYKTDYENSDLYIEDTLYYLIRNTKTNEVMLAKELPVEKVTEAEAVAYKTWHFWNFDLYGFFKENVGDYGEKKGIKTTVDYLLKYIKQHKIQPERREFKYWNKADGDQEHEVKVGGRKYFFVFNDNDKHMSIGEEVA